MSIHNEEEFKISQNGKNYSINISILEDQLSLELTLFSNPPKKYSGFFSLNELRISSKIFNHTKTLFEAKEIIKRTVIKKQLLIDENEHRANLTFDTGLGHDSVPFPIILFRDSSEKYPNKSLKLPTFENPQNNMKKSNGMNNKNNNNNNNQENISHKENNTNNNQNINNNIKNLRASIGNNINNKMLNQNKIMDQNIKKANGGNIQFNNSMKRPNNLKDNNINNNINNNKNIINNNKNNDLNFKKIDLVNNINSANANNTKDYFNLNNNILYNIYNNMNNANNVNSSFYKNLQNSFALNNDNNYVYNKINNNNIPLTRQNIRNIDNNIMTQSFTNQNFDIPRDTISKKTNNPQLVMNPNLNNYQVNHNNNINNNINNYNQQKPTFQQYNQNINNPLNNPEIVAYNQSFNTAPIRKNLTKIPNADNTFFLNRSNILANNKNKTFDINQQNNNDNKRLSTSSSEENDENENNMDENIEEFNPGEQPYRFKNLIIKGPKKIKGNLEKFKENQNMGDYVPSGTKFVSYLKFPDTKINTNKSMTASTISSSLTSGSNRIVGIEKNIIKNPGELEEITFRIQRILNKRNIKYKLLYKASIDGDTSAKFHEKCDKIPNTLVLIKASGDKRFGGFTTKTWDGEDLNKKDNDCFIFSIDKMKVYDIIKGKNSIKCNPDLGPVFINQIKLLDKCFTQGGTTNKKGITFKTSEDFEITGGAEKFGVREVEVYQVK